MESLDKNLKQSTPATTLNIDFDRGSLLLEIDTGPPLREQLRGVDMTYDTRISKWRADALHYRAIMEKCVQNNIKVIDNVAQWSGVNWPNPLLPPLRNEQQEAVNAWLKEKKGLVVMPTGTGKTEVALAIMNRLKIATLVIAPVRDLMYQWQRRIQKGLGYDAGIIGDNTYDLRPISCTTYHSAYIHMEKLGNQFGLIVFDECHHLPGLNRQEIALMNAAPYRLGLTATPERSDGGHLLLTELVGPTVTDLPIADVKGSTLADYDVFRIPVYLLPEEKEAYDEAGKKISNYMIEQKKDPYNDDFQWKDLINQLNDSPEAREVFRLYHYRQSIETRAVEKIRVLEDIFKLHIHEPILIFTDSNAMARDISLRFLIPCLLNHCGKRERHEILQCLRDGVYHALVANQVLDEGIDIPEIKVAVVLGGKGSQRQAKQRLGRILRKSGNKKGILYEVVCNNTGDANRSRKRRQSDAYEGTRNRNI